MHILIVINVKGINIWNIIENSNVGCKTTIKST